LLTEYFWASSEIFNDLENSLICYPIVHHYFQWNCLWVITHQGAARVALTVLTKSTC
jgi:hypothetical protein